MERIAESFIMEVMFENGLVKKYEIPFEENLEINQEDFTNIIKVFRDGFKESYKELLGAYITFTEINGINVTISISKTCSVEFYIKK